MNGVMSKYSLHSEKEDRDVWEIVV